MFEETAIKKIQFHEGLALGLFLTSLFSALTFAAAKDWNLSQETFVDLIVPIAALGAAAFTVASIQKQMQQERELVAEQLSRKLQADRALLGLALHELYDFFLQATRQVVHPKSGYAFDWDRIVSVCKTIARCVENADPETSQNLAKLVSNAQILAARHRNLLESVELSSVRAPQDVVSRHHHLHSRSQIATQLVDFVLLCAAGFKYSRFEEETYSTPVIDGSRIENHFKFAVDIDIESHPLWPEIQKWCYR
ncbi:hypothetical protein GS636_04370 [Ruegeria sp. HKCCD4884]|uniref:hypothetical protein n=1 Tax=Ruegeria sp. HKCCD4884 TaxID=2683022 RepID=UPI001491E8DC|nr:hypothetical protein [Ruegeria sp. HKCCD4884]NOD92019.1 hypothetical protein [Ruegeria sp. HKCCD4884]